MECMVNCVTWNGYNKQKQNNEESRKTKKKKKKESCSFGGVYLNGKPYTPSEKENEQTFNFLA